MENNADNFEGPRLIVVVSNKDFYYFKLPQSLQELQIIEDNFKFRGKLEFICETTSGDYEEIPLKSYEDYKKAWERCRTAQGLIVNLKITKKPFIKNQWKCKRCMHPNGNNDRCLLHIQLYQIVI